MPRRSEITPQFLTLTETRSGLPSLPARVVPSSATISRMLASSSGSHRPALETRRRFFCPSSPSPPAAGSPTTSAATPTTSPAKPNSAWSVPAAAVASASGGA